MVNAAEQNYNLVIVPGGIAEMLKGAEEQNEIVFLRARKGFIRFAILHGLQLVPIYGFGENQVKRSVVGCC